MNNQTEEAMSPERLSTIRFGRLIDWIITISIMMIAIVFIILLQSLPQRATFFPWFITISIMIVGGVYCWKKISKPQRWDNHYDPDARIEHGEHDCGPAYLVEHARGILRSLIVFTSLIIATIVIGPEYAVPAFVTLRLWFSRENRVVALLSGIGFWLLIHYVFGDFMSINLPSGYLTDYLQ